MLWIRSPAANWITPRHFASKVQTTNWSFYKNSTVWMSGINWRLRSVFAVHCHQLRIRQSFNILMCPMNSFIVRKIAFDRWAIRKSLSTGKTLPTPSSKVLNLKSVRMRPTIHQSICRRCSAKSPKSPHNIRSVKQLCDLEWSIKLSAILRWIDAQMVQPHAPPTVSAFPTQSMTVTA